MISTRQAHALGFRWFRHNSDFRLFADRNLFDPMVLCGPNV